MSRAYARWLEVVAPNKNVRPFLTDWRDSPLQRFDRVVVGWMRGHAVDMAEGGAGGDFRLVRRVKNVQRQPGRRSGAAHGV